MSDYLCSSCNEDGMVCIPRAQYEAYDKAAKMLGAFASGEWASSECDCNGCRAARIIAALRSAGIDLEDKT